MNPGSIRLFAETIALGIELDAIGGTGLRYRPLSAVEPSLRADLILHKHELISIVCRLALPPLRAGVWAKAAAALLSRFENADVRTELRQRFEERAAVHEFEAGLGLEDAERLAFLGLARTAREMLS